MESKRWKLVAGGAALIGIATGGFAAADADDALALDLNDRRGAIVLADSPPTTVDIEVVDDRPQSADSPNETIEESTDSPFDSPDDRERVDRSPQAADSPDRRGEESADSPAEDPEPAQPSAESIDSPADSPEDPEVAPPAEAAPAPPPPGDGGGDSSISDDSTDSPDVGESSDS